MRRRLRTRYGLKFSLGGWFPTAGGLGTDRRLRFGWRRGVEHPQDLNDDDPLQRFSITTSRCVPPRPSLSRTFWQTNGSEAPTKFVLSPRRVRFPAPFASGRNVVAARGSRGGSGQGTFPGAVLHRGRLRGSAWQPRAVRAGAENFRRGSLAAHGIHSIQFRISAGSNT
jgi:hypothetical protein